MVIKCWKEDGKWKFDEREASLIPSLRVLFQEKATKFGREYAVFVVLYADPLSIYANFDDESDRHKMVAHAVWGDGIPTKVLKDKLIVEACDEYERISNTMEAKAQKAMKNALGGIVNQLEGTKITAENMKEVGDIAAKIPTWLESYKKMTERAETEEHNVLEKVKGEATLSWAEKKAMQK